MTQQTSQRALHAAQILWPAFLAAAVMEMVVFSWVDPTTLRWGNWQPDSQTAYSLSFLTFWVVIAVASLVSHWMMKSQRTEAEFRPQADVREARGAQKRGSQRARHAHQHHHA
jgi:uncharacterized MAPEG superfamily protein